VEAGVLTVQGSDGIGTYTCVRNAPTCTFQVSGIVLSSSDSVQIIGDAGAYGGTCATTAQSTVFVSPRTSADAGGNATLQSYDAGTGSLQGRYRVCYCPNHLGCDADAEFTHQAGLVDVRGPQGSEDQACTAGVTCTMGAFTGHLLSTDDQVGFMAHSGACITTDKDASTEIMQSQFRSVDATGGALATGAPHVLSYTNTAVTVAAVDLPKGGSWRICYCTNYDSCDQYQDYTVEAGVLTVQGADGIGTYTCVRYAPMCAFQVVGTVLSGNDNVQIIGDAGAYGGTCATTAESTVFVSPRKLADAGGSTTDQSFEPAAITWKALALSLLTVFVCIFDRAAW
jgi:hypothetical protein